jgi:uncharacterized membrane protein
MRKLILITMMLSVFLVALPQEGQLSIPDEEARIEQAIKDFEKSQTQDSNTLRAAVLSSFIILFIIPYLLFCALAAFVGSFRVIGAAWSLVISIFLTPVTGLIVAATSERKTAVEFRKKVTNEINEQRAILEKILMK